ncbi:dihydroxyacetone kinase subunit L [Liquorilactobacillus satsumensis]|uniref:dihydroxyacetone kinase subunit DhaL n=1 Tax=Liquorilactobacillus satsumensis TaxID=259059 RepID=UPI0021C25724|nr:dihydroxyacetone kinase subunit DhaL [Liquorilactobacillus satsumensis]MCP9312263.1 dihydroxyacetone kinase subunit L [Liquorilactobacillus satsumensis]MCP9359542.1 dihydroxyacetone kinase subunit L [Liquorilactobacillus satsumensis]
MLTVELTKKWMELFYAQIDQEKAYLSELDTPIGDGDHGNNMKRGVDGVKDSLAKLKDPTLKETLRTIAMALISKVGGASGPLYGTAFLEMAKKCDESQEPAILFAAALEGIKKRGGAKEGDKTMVDVWAPTVKALTDGSFGSEQIKQAVASTKEMIARKGRASYLGERSVGHLDPGAMSSGYLFETFIAAGGVK